MLVLVFRHDQMGSLSGSGCTGLMGKVNGSGQSKLICRNGVRIGLSRLSSAGIFSRKSKIQMEIGTLKKLEVVGHFHLNKSNLDGNISRNFW